MTFLAPWVLVALPLAALPLWLAWRARRVESPAPFSSLYLVEKAYRDERHRALSRSRWLQIVRTLIVVVVVLAAARPVGPGRGGPEHHAPTRVVVAVDISGSTSQRLEGGVVAWERIRSAADSLLATARGDDTLVLTAFADDIVGWWEAPPPALRRQLASLEPSARPSDWPRVLASLARRIDDSTESYLFTDGAIGTAAPTRPASLSGGYRVVRSTGSAASVNRGLVGGERRGDGRIALRAQLWGPDTASEAVVAGRRVAGRVLGPAALPADGRPSPAAWEAPDTASFSLVGADPLPLDDRWYMVSPRARPTYRVGRWAPGDDPPEPGGLFWSTALEASSGDVDVVEAEGLNSVLAGAPELALLPLRAYRPAEVRLLEAAVANGTRLLFTPSCAAEACVPVGEWLPSPSLRAPRLVWSLAPPGRSTTLRARGGPDGGATPALPAHLLTRAPIRPAIAVDGPAPEWSWALETGEPALWVSGPLAVWLAPLGPPVTHLGTTPIFPMIASAALDAWDPRWAEGGRTRLAGSLWRGGSTAATISGPLASEVEAHERLSGRTPPVRLAAPGIYRIEGAETSFVAVNVSPGEGNLRPVDDATWERAWGVAPTPEAAWRDRIFPNRQGPELRTWFLALALVGLAVEAALRAGVRSAWRR